MKKKTVKKKTSTSPEYITDLPLHLLTFGMAVENERDTCRKFLTDAMETYDDAVYDAVIDATPKDVIEAMKKGREAIIGNADSILSVACSCASEEIPAPTINAMLEDMGEREAGEYIACIVSEMHANGQYAFLSTFLHNLTRGAREQLETLT
jgi:hypothetical protein